MPDARRPPGDKIEIEAKVAFLRRPDAYPEPTRSVEVLETHMSWVFLTDAHAYKLKKPVRYGLLDYTTVAARQWNCEQEVALNRLLAPDVYLGTVPLTTDAQGALRIGGKGPVVDWLVKMRRLRVEDTLQYAIEAAAIRKEDVVRVARRLCAFYRDRPKEKVSPEAYCATIRAQIAEDRDTLLLPKYGLEQAPIEDIAAAQGRFLDREGDLLAGRARSERVVEGHGDLRPEHIYLGDPPLIVDCLEFHRALRIVDPASELAFLAMECDRLGAPAIDAWLFEVYRAEMRDDPPRRLVDFYKGRHALTRAVIAIRHLDDGPALDPRKWRERTARYLGLAAVYANHFETPA